MSNLKHHLKCSTAHDGNDDFTCPKMMAILVSVSHIQGEKYYVYIESNISFDLEIHIAVYSSRLNPSTKQFK